MHIVTLIAMGVVVGFIAAIPLGPINIYVVSNTLKRDFVHGLMGGFTAAVLDVFFCLAFLLSIKRVVDLIARYSTIMKVVAALLLTGIGIRLILQGRALAASGWPNRPARISARPIMAVFLLYVSNPALYGFWLATAGLVTAHRWVASSPDAWGFALAVGLGSVLWYFLLVRYVNRHHHQLHPATFGKILHGLAFVLFLLAGFSLASLFFPGLTASL
ncbi:MAG: LysE family transporter [Candidatus Aminicenantes bacterium]|nr:LysE family transporter [Candidatus Aminicenantes bacterium]